MEIHIGFRPKRKVPILKLKCLQKDIYKVLSSYEKKKYLELHLAPVSIQYSNPTVQKKRSINNEIVLEK